MRRSVRLELERALELAASAVARPFVLRRFTIDDQTWTPIVCPIACDGVHLYSIGLKDADVRTTVGDPETEQLLLGGTPIVADSALAGSAGSPFTNATLFTTTEIVCYVRSRVGLDVFLGQFLGRSV